MSPALLPEKPLPWDQRQRFMFLEAHLIWRGNVAPGRLRDSFDITTARAERDFAHYLRLAPDSLVRDRASGEYRASDSFVPRFLRGTASEYLQVLRNHDIAEGLSLAMAATLAVEVLEPPEREFDVRVLARLNSAIRERRWLSIDYQSMNHPDPRRMEIAPHVLACAQRWHARAWSSIHQGYRDFLLSRICGLPELRGPCDRNPDMDWDWRTQMSIKIAPHPDLTPAQKRVVEQDYGMLHGMRERGVRIALVPYYLRMLGIGRGDVTRPPQEQQIVLLNAADLESLNRLS
ncbi:MAG: WYL domain-containing protein [Panacagrimonas sp.]